MSEHSLPEEKRAELPSDAMQRKFQDWEEQYTVEKLTDMTSSEIEDAELRFENEAFLLRNEHNPGRLIAQDPMLAQSAGKPPYTANQWEQARKEIRRKEKKIKFRFQRAKGIVKKDEKESKREWYTGLFSIISDAVSWSI